MLSCDVIGMRQPPCTSREQSWNARLFTGALVDEDCLLLSLIFGIGQDSDVHVIVSRRSIPGGDRV